MTRPLKSAFGYEIGSNAAATNPWLTVGIANQQQPIWFVDARLTRPIVSTADTLIPLATRGDVTVELQCAPSLDYQSGDGLRLAVSFDDAPAQIVKLDTWATLQTWERSVADGIRRVTTKHRIDHSGPHVLKYWMVTPGVVLERIIIDAGGVRPSYLGPNESPQLHEGKAAGWPVSASTSRG